MPTAIKQSATKKKKTIKKKSIVDRIQPAGTSNLGIRINIYGRGKTGKTRLLSTFPKPALIIGTEDGTKSVANVKGLDFVKLQNSGDLDDLLELLEGGKYKSVGLDQAGGLQDIILREVLGLEELPIQRSWGMASRSDWGTCGLQTKQRLRSLLALAETHAINVAIIAHERNFEEDNESDLVFPTVGSALSPSVAGWLNGACDYICQTFIKEETKDKKITVGGKAVVTQHKTGGKDYCLRVGPHPVYMTGFRLPPGVDLPEFIIDPSFAKIDKLIKGT